MQFDNFHQLVQVVPEEIRERLEKLKTHVDRNDRHPEPNAYYHTMIVTERLMKTGDANLVMAGLFHDIGKPDVARPHPKLDGVITPGSEKIGCKAVRRHSRFIRQCGADPRKVEEIIDNHTRFRYYYNMRDENRDKMRSLSTFEQLKVFVRADDMLKEFRV